VSIHVLNVKALGWLLSVPGAWRTVLEASIPYSRASMVQLLGKVGRDFCIQRSAGSSGECCCLV
jgi:hypothetical protein